MAIKYGYIFKKSKTKLTSLNIVFNLGSAYETVGYRGISHLMEHLIAKPLDKYEDRFLNDCIETNAYTSLNHIVVYFKGLDTKLTPELKQELVDCVLNGFNEVTKEEFENEKQVVIQEAFDCFEEPSVGHLTNILYGYYGISLPVGIPEEVNSFTYENAKKWAKKYFTKPARIVEVGRTSTEFKNVKYTKKLWFEPIIPKYKDTKQIIKNVQSGDKVNIYAMSKRIINKADYPYIMIGLSMLCDGMLSPFCQEIRVKNGYSYYVAASSIMCYHKGVITIQACTTQDNKEKLINLFQKLSQNIKRYLTKKRFNVIINLLKTRREIDKCLWYKNIFDLLIPEELAFPANLDKIDYQKVVDITTKYFGNNFVIFAR